MSTVGWVYFVRCADNGLIKIGWTRECPDLRFLALQSAMPVELEKIGVMPVARHIEQTLHREFGRHRVRGEWFRPASNLLAFIAMYTKPWPSSSYRAGRGSPEWIAKQNERESEGEGEWTPKNDRWHYLGGVVERNP